MPELQKRKSWVKIGTIYGIIGAIFYIGIVYTWAFLNANQCGAQTQCGEPMGWVTFIGLALFSPLMIFPSAVLSFFGPKVPDYVRTLVMVISLPVMGAILGMVFGYFVEWWGKCSAKRDENPQ